MKIDLILTVFSNKFIVKLKKTLMRKILIVILGLIANICASQEVNLSLKPSSISIGSLIYSPNGKYFITITSPNLFSESKGRLGRRITIWDSETGFMLKNIFYSETFGNELNTFSTSICDVHPIQNKMIVTVGKNLGVVKYIEENEVVPIQNWPFNDWITSIKYSNDGNKLAVSLGQTIYILNEKDMKIEKKYFDFNETRTIRSDIKKIEFSQDNKKILLTDDLLNLTTIDLTNDKITEYDVNSKNNEWDYSYSTFATEDKIFDVRKRLEQSVFKVGISKTTVGELSAKWLIKESNQPIVYIANCNQKTGLVLIGIKYINDDKEMYCNVLKEQFMLLTQDGSNTKSSNNLWGLNDKLYLVEISPDAKRILTLGENSGFNIWDSRTGNLVRQIYSGEKSRVYLTFNEKKDSISIYKEQNQIFKYNIPYPLLLQEKLPEINLFDDSTFYSSNIKLIVHRIGYDSTKLVYYVNGKMFGNLKLPGETLLPQNWYHYPYIFFYLSYDGGITLNRLDIKNNNEITKFQIGKSDDNHYPIVKSGIVWNEGKYVTTHLSIKDYKTWRELGLVSTYDLVDKKVLNGQRTNHIEVTFKLSINDQYLFVLKNEKSFAIDKNGAKTYDFYRYIIDADLNPNTSQVIYTCDDGESNITSLVKSREFNNLQQKEPGNIGIGCKFSDDGKNYIIWRRNDISYYSTDKNKQIWKININHPTIPIKADFINEKLLAVIYGDLSLQYIDNIKGNVIATMYHYVDKEKLNWLIVTPDGYWDSSSDAGNFIAYKQKMSVFPVDQFAVKYNRPDIILQRFGNSNKELISHYYSIYTKRLRRLELKEKDLESDFNAPVVQVLNESRSDRILNLVLHFEDSKSKIIKYNIFVNNVPIFGQKSKPLAIPSKKFQTNETITLCSGDNKIEVSCTNEKGVESYRKVLFANGSSNPERDLYILAFGVSQYKNSILNLNYAHKDALDMAELFNNFKGKGYTNVYSKVFINEQVTPEAIIQSKEFIKDSKVDDTFILFIAGHGMYDKDNESTYYYLTHNTELDNLSATAINFKTIEELLQGIPPRNKLFFMDACESGEKDEQIYVSLTSKSNTNLISRGFINKNSTLKNNMHQYLLFKDKYIYNDILRRSGAIVFSSSKGGENSYERSDIQNGLFTFYVKKALSSNVADSNNDGFVTIDELKNYVSALVSKETNGSQNPTIDRDNIYNKFNIQFKISKTRIVFK